MATDRIARGLRGCSKRERQVAFARLVMTLAAHGWRYKPRGEMWTAFLRRVGGRRR